MESSSSEEEEEPKKNSSSQNSSASNNLIFNRNAGGILNDIEDTKSRRIPPLRQLKRLEPKLFVSPSKDGKYKGYSRSCLWNYRKQPIILTKEEKERIDNVNPGSYKESIEYGYDRNNKHHFICPAYWDFKRDIPLSEEEFKEKKLSKYLLKDEKSPITEDKYIFSFQSKNCPLKEYPGFLNKINHPEEHFMPCCFGEDHKTSRKYQTTIDAMKLMEGIIEDKENKIDKNSYIQNHLKHPLNMKRIGHLTISLSKFLDYNSVESFKDKKEQTSNALLRIGTFNKENSFMNCLTLIFDYKTVDDLIKVIIKNVHLDNILEFHNGTIPRIFLIKIEKLKLIH